MTMTTGFETGEYSIFGKAKSIENQGMNAQMLDENQCFFPAFLWFLGRIDVDIYPSRICSYFGLPDNYLSGEALPPNLG